MTGNCKYLVLVATVLICGVVSEDSVSHRNDTEEKEPTPHSTSEDSNTTTAVPSGLGKKDVGKEYYYYDSYYDRADDAYPYIEIETIPVCEDNQICVTKCCPEGEILNERDDPSGCTPPHPNETHFELKFEHRDGREASVNGEVTWNYGFPSCSRAGVMPSGKVLRVLPNGRLFITEEFRELTSQDYCIDNFRRSNAVTGEDEYVVSAIVCHEEYITPVRETVRFYLHTTLIEISILCLFFKIICFGAIKELRTVPGLCLLSHSLCLLLHFVLLLTNHLVPRFRPGLACSLLGLGLYISAIAFNLWLSVMCYDIWKYVRLSVRGIPFDRMNNGRSQYIRYSAFVWSVCLILLVVSATLQFLPHDALPNYVIRPAIAVKRCFIVDDDANMLVYFYGPLSFIFFVTFCFITSTIFYLKQGGAQILCCGSSSFGSESTVFNANNINIFWNRFQIFILTTVIWTTEILSWKIPPEELWEVTDVVNCSQGIILFVLFLKQKQKRDLIVKKIYRVFGRESLTSVRDVSSTVSTGLERTNSETRSIIGKQSSAKKV